jgi:cyclophilin family peptidyl-prolyl cis-trans isomerase
MVRYNCFTDAQLICVKANSGPNSQSSQFFITTGAAEELDGKHGNQLLSPSRIHITRHDL